MFKLITNLRFLIIPGFIYMLWIYGVILYETCIIALIVSFILFVIFPLIFCYSITIQKSLLFMTFVHGSNEHDLNRPQDVGLYATRNFFINYKDVDDQDIKLGTWHILPDIVANRFEKILNLADADRSEISVNQMRYYPHNGELNEAKAIELETRLKNMDHLTDQIVFEELLKSVPGTVILYLHGNSGSRKFSHRVNLYKIFRGLGYHVFTFDYRGYADSTNISPSEEGLVSDAINVYQYIVNNTKSLVFIWGHSLGTGVGTHMLAELRKMDIAQPKGIFLEAPFNNIHDELEAHSMAQIFKILPWFEYTIPGALTRNNIHFASDQHIMKFHQPVCILHAEDDFIVPFKLGYKLYRTAIEGRNKSFGPLEFHRFDWHNNIGHRNIYQVPILKDIIRNFVDNYKNEYY